jgi:hypothetical protein
MNTWKRLILIGIISSGMKNIASILPQRPSEPKQFDEMEELCGKCDMPGLKY